MSFQAFTHNTLVIVDAKRTCSFTQAWIPRPQTEVEYDIEVKVSSNASKLEDTSDDDEPEANEPFVDKNWLAQYEAERQKEQEQVISVLPQVRLMSLYTWRCLSSSGNKRKCRII